MIHYKSENLEFARHNRKQRNATRQEGILWHCVLKKAAYRFYRQYRVGSYILDFYCPKKKLAIELDGGQHFGESEIISDTERTLYLNQNGIFVLRFPNSDIDKNLGSVAEKIRLTMERILN